MKKFIIIISFSLTCILTEAQVFVKSTGQIITENAIIGSPVILKQSYQVKNKKTGKVYGRDGRKDFGHYYSIGVKTATGLVLTDAALKPWLYDSAFKKVEQDYDPVISLTEVLEIGNKERQEFYQCPLQMGRQQPEGMWIANENAADPNAMEIDKEAGSKDGWLLWFVSKKSLDDVSEFSIDIQSISKKIEVNNGNGDMEVEAPNENDLILGGIYVCPAFLGGGHIAYRLVGLTFKDDKQWKLRTPFVGYSFDKQQVEESQQEVPTETAEEEPEDDVMLTPVESGKSKKKEKNKNNKK